MTAQAEREAVGTLLSGWVTTDVQWPNKAYTPKNGTSYTRVVLQAADGRQLEFGADKVVHRQPGILLLMVFWPADRGDAGGRTIADSLAARFRRKRVEFTDGSILFRTPTIRAIGEDGAFYQFNVSVPFVRDNLF